MKKKRYSQEHVEQLNNQIRMNFQHVFPISEDMHISHDGISRLVMLDRYSQKDPHLKTLQKGDLVIAKIKYDPKFPTLGTGFIAKINPNYVWIDIEEEYLSQVDENLEKKGNLVKLSKEHISKPLEIYYEQIARRVGNSLAKDEDQRWAKVFYEEIANKNIVPAGRVLYGAGSNTSVTYFNCFVMPMPHDSRQGISDHRKEVMEIMSRGGGVGTNGSTLRPKNSAAISVGGTSSGAVSWLNDLASLTDLVQQGGSRRGAQMIMLQSWHPDILEFIISKMQKPQILEWISQNFQDEDIKRLARDKLKFRPWTDFEKRIFADTIKNSQDKKLIQDVKEKLELGGEYEVVNTSFLTGANISVGITKEFMNAVKKDDFYELKFPDVSNFNVEQKKVYEEEWQEIGDVRVWERKGFPVKVYKKIKAKEMWDLINFCATYSAEPGVFFIDRANEMTNAVSYGQKVVCTNPCGEQPLAPYSVCNLSALNLNNFVDHHTGTIFWDKLKKTVQHSVRMQDNIIDQTPYFLKANKIQATGERRIGMGVMGLHDFLIWHGQRYGSKESLTTIDKLFAFITQTAYEYSAKLGREKGHFSFMKDLDRLLMTGFIKTLPEVTRKVIKDNGGLRNSHLLTIAPTGSTGTMIGVSTGLEPYFAFKYFRSGRLGKFIEVDQKIVEEWKKVKKYKEKQLPNIFVSAMDLSPEEHADVQCVIQRWMDSSISKTVNAPKGYSVKQVEKIYMRLYDKKAKGGTVYVDGSRESQVLSMSNEENDLLEEKVDKLVISQRSSQKIENVNKRHEDVPGNKFAKDIGINVGDLCPICKEGTVEDIGGCNSCTNCGAQLKCGL